MDRALQQSMEVFRTKGFKSTSYEDLTRATQVKKQSFYCLFKDKRALFIQVLRLYREQSIARLEKLASQDSCPLKKLKAITNASLRRDNETECGPCLMVNSIMEFGTEDKEIAREISLMLDELEQIIEKIVHSGQEQGLITTRLTSKEIAAYLNNVWSGAKVAEKSGASNERIDIALHAAFALLKP
ncbi:TetR/AcrR family transcriptional regulator [Paenibacillus sp. y28]|uniref:TetR/AcrR family transcriptional regulator n=1 Tax=Paenibacillus sp. y28 TaxID=3129110 RepID=UPI0030197B59